MLSFKRIVTLILLACAPSFAQELASTLAPSSGTQLSSGSKFTVAAGGGGIAIVNHTSGCAATTFTTAAINNTGANSLYCLVTSSNAAPVVSDSSSNTWITTLTNASNSTSFATTKLFYVTNATVSASQTFTVTAAAAAPSMECISFSGTAASSSFDQQNQTNNGSGTTINTGSITFASNEVAIAGIGFDAADGFLNIGSGFTLIEQQNFGVCYGSGLGYLISTPATVNPLWTTGNTTHNQAKIASFK